MEFKENGMVLMKENVKLSQEHKSAYNIQHPGNLSTLNHYSPIHNCLTRDASTTFHGKRIQISNLFEQ